MKAFDQLWRIREREMRSMKAKRYENVKLSYVFPCLVTYPGCYTPSEQGGVFSGKDVTMTYTTVDGKIVEVPFDQITYNNVPSPGLIVIDEDK
jgi:hypothetical protein